MSREEVWQDMIVYGIPPWFSGKEYDSFFWRTAWRFRGFLRVIFGVHEK